MIQQTLLIAYILLSCQFCVSVNLTGTQQYEKEFRESIKNGMEWTVERNLTLGPILGNIVEAGNFSAEVYNSVPYAKSPVGVRRFEKPERLAPWKTKINTTKIIQCWHYRSAMVVHMWNDEDCLFFKIVIPLDANGERYKEKLPAVFWIHGGSYNFGSKEYYVPKNIVQHFSSKKIIFIAPNYRIGVFGFLTALHPELPGNYGLEDMILALNVVRENAENFGIDQSRITVSGESAGAGAASILAASPRTDGLFSAVVLTSGTSQAHWGVRTKSTKISSDKAIRKCNCERSTVAETKDCMKKSGFGCITQFFQDEPSKRVSWYETIRMGYSLLTPVIDDYRGNESIIPEKIEHLVEKEARMPILMSSTTHERFITVTILDGVGNLTGESLRIFELYLSNRSESLISWNIKSRKFVIQAIRQFYKFDEGDAYQIPGKMGEMLTDDWLASLYEEALMYSKRGQPVYLIQNNPRISASDLSFHGVDAAKVFGTKYQANGCVKTYEDCMRGTSEKWLKAYIAVLAEFIRTRKVSSLLPFTPKQRNAYLISHNGTEIIDYFTEKYYFWRQTIPTLEKLVLEENMTSKMSEEKMTL